MKKARDFKLAARGAFKGRYWQAFLAGLIALLLGGLSAYESVGGGGTAYSRSAAQASGNTGIADMAKGLNPFEMKVFAGALVFAIIVALVMTIIGCVVELGYNKYNISLFQSSETPSIGTLFSFFSIFGKAFWLRILLMVKVFLWSLLLVIPGIIASYRYAMAPYILAENPGMSAHDAIEKSKELMNGNKWRLFCLEFSFIGWFLLSALTCGIGFVFLQPYVAASRTAFYLELNNRLQPTVIPTQAAAVS